MRVAAGPEGFVSAIEAALAERTPALARTRVEAMTHESWEARVEQISQLIDETRGHVRRVGEGVHA